MIDGYYSLSWMFLLLSGISTNTEITSRKRIAVTSKSEFDKDDLIWHTSMVAATRSCDSEKNITKPSTEEYSYSMTTIKSKQDYTKVFSLGYATVASDPDENDADIDVYSGNTVTKNIVTSAIEKSTPATDGKTVVFPNDNERTVSKHRGHRRQKYSSIYRAEMKPFVMLGTEDFCQLVILDGRTFVDKTDFVRDILMADKRVVLIIWERKWGKTLNMDMLRRFLQTEVDHSGASISARRSVNRKLFDGGLISVAGCDNEYVRLSRLEISNNNNNNRSDITARHRGRYPVIFVSFKYAIGDTFAEVVDKTMRAIGSLFVEHGYLMNGLHGVDEKSKFDTYCSMANEDSADENGIVRRLTDSLRYLSELLHRHYRRKVYVLIDDYDMPLAELYYRPSKSCPNVGKSDVPQTIDESDCKRTYRLFREMFDNAFRRNPYLEKAVVSGLQRLPSSLDIFSGYEGESDLFEEYNISSTVAAIEDRRSDNRSGSVNNGNSERRKPFCRHYGFSEEEINRLLDNLAMKNVQAASVYGEKYPCEYGEGNAKSNSVVYNPWQVMLNILNRRTGSNFTCENQLLA